ncbi:hypothetical protein CH63R_01654 [Colletotrichum higginsianum IMI 349063]|uniref:Uncharacterized protein n=2 Tax=Colletotrichum destructivum species complex TaxID=2707350 RepID=A0A1B7YWZ4_COLHI|nr:hypothetical protein CH63R_01654 [Colletotrichum higginsianum IMI 349063]OBR16474.1 hypothetical protein CH63R_01654 [Colletotrichum higginsianum IMI 349063]
MSPSGEATALFGTNEEDAGHAWQRDHRGHGTAAWQAVDNWAENAKRLGDRTRGMSQVAHARYEVCRGGDVPVWFGAE